MSTAGFADEGWESPAGPPLPQRVRQWTVTRESLTAALGRTGLFVEPDQLGTLAGEILGHLPPTASLALPASVPPPLPDHECSFMLSDGICKHPGCGKTWARNVAELNLDAALRAFAATEPAPPRDGDGLAALADEWLAVGRTAPLDDGALLAQLGEALTAGVHPAARRILLPLAAALDGRAGISEGSGRMDRASAFREAASMTRQRAGVAEPGMAPAQPVAAPEAPAASVAATDTDRPPWMPLRGSEGLEPDPWGEL